MREAEVDVAEDVKEILPQNYITLAITLPFFLRKMFLYMTKILSENENAKNICDSYFIVSKAISILHNKCKY